MRPARDADRPIAGPPPIKLSTRTLANPREPARPHPLRGPSLGLSRLSPPPAGPVRGAPLCLWQRQAAPSPPDEPRSTSPGRARRPAQGPQTSHASISPSRHRDGVVGGSGAYGSGSRPRRQRRSGTGSRWLRRRRRCERGTHGRLGDGGYQRGGGTGRFGGGRGQWSAGRPHGFGSPASRMKFSAPLAPIRQHKLSERFTLMAVRDLLQVLGWFPLLLPPIPRPPVHPYHQKALHFPSKAARAKEAAQRTPKCRGRPPK